MTYYSDWGPTDSWLLHRDSLPALDVYDAPDRTRPVGTAHGVGIIVGNRGPLVVFRLVVDRVHGDERWFCRGRRFVRFGEAAEGRESSRR